MIYYVKTGEVDTSIEATSHRHAAVKALKGRSKGLGVVVVVNDAEEESMSDGVFFLTRNILEECSMRLVS